MTNGLAADGWSEQATPVEGGLVRCEKCGESVPAGEVGLDSLSRIEGASDPGDMAIVVALTCPRCSSRNALVLKYGPGASAADADVLMALPELPT